MTDTILPLQDAVFEIGERTVRVMRDQTFALDDYGTRDGQSISPVLEIAVEVPLSPDPLVRVELKIDAALGAIRTLQRRIDSMDAVLAVIINR